MITSSQYDDFCKGISANNKIVDECNATRDAMYSSLAESIKETFFAHYKRTPTVEFQYNGELIIVRLSLNYRESLNLTKELLADLIMPVKITVDYDEDTDLDVLVFELYPKLEDDLGGDP